MVYKNCTLSQTLAGQKYMYLTAGYLVISCTLKMVTESVPEMEYFHTLTWPSAQEDCIEVT
jgi:hypothetical protein